MATKQLYLVPFNNSMKQKMIHQHFKLGFLESWKQLQDTPKLFILKRIIRRKEYKNDQ